MKMRADAKVCEQDSTSARVSTNLPSSSNASSMIKRSQFRSRQEPSSSEIPVSFMEDRPSCCYERRKLPDSGFRQSCRHGRRKLPDPGCGQSCCHGQRKLPDPGDRQTCCHEQRKLPGRQSCCHEQRKLPDPGGGPSCHHRQRKLPDPEDIRQEADKVLVTNRGAGEPSISSMSASNSKAGVPNMSSSYDHDRFEQRPEQPVRLLSPRPEDGRKPNSIRTK